MIEVDISLQLLGVLSSIVAAGFSLIPALGATDTRRALVAIAVLVAGVFIEQGMAFGTLAEFGQTFFAAALYAVGTYKLFLQPIVTPAVTAAFQAVTARARG